MTIMYHGSGFKHGQLKPGFAHNGVLVKWDGSETNEWLYATTDKDEAIGLGLASAVDKKYELSRYKSKKDTIEIQLESGKKPSKKDLGDLKVYLYTIAKKDDDGWEKNANHYNGMKTEYKTKETIEDAILTVEEIDIEEWLSGKELEVSVEDVSSTHPSALW